MCMYVSDKRTTKQNTSMVRTVVKQFVQVSLGVNFEVYK